MTHETLDFEFVADLVRRESAIVLGTAETTRGIDDGFEAVRLGALTAFRPC